MLPLCSWSRCAPVGRLAERDVGLAPYPCGRGCQGNLDRSHTAVRRPRAASRSRQAGAPGMHALASHGRAGRAWVAAHSRGSSKPGRLKGDPATRPSGRGRRVHRRGRAAGPRPRLRHADVHAADVRGPRRRDAAHPQRRRHAGRPRRCGAAPRGRRSRPARGRRGAPPRSALSGLAHGHSQGISWFIHKKFKDHCR